MELLPATQQLPSRSRVTSQRLLDDWLAGRKETTRRAYAADLEYFARWLGTSRSAAVRELLERHPGDANALALEWRAAMSEGGLSPATINRRLSALRSLVGLAQTLGVVQWTLRVRSLPARSYRDTRGPGRQGYLRMLRDCGDPDAAGRNGIVARRNRAILRLLYDLALRRGELVELDLEDLDLAEERLSILGKGRLERESLSLPEPTLAALRAWLEARGSEPGPLFVRLDNARRPRGLERITGKAVYLLARRLGSRPHGLRHAAITDALDLTGGDVRQVRRFSRHASLRTLAVYDDAREDLAGVVAKRVAGAAAEAD